MEGPGISTQPRRGGREEGWGKWARLGGGGGGKDKVVQKVIGLVYQSASAHMINYELKNKYQNNQRIL